MSNKLVNVPLCVPQIVPLHKDTQYKKTRKYVTHEQISLLAKQRGKMGITLNEVMASFACRKNQAQRKLKNMHSSDILFTAGDLISQGLEPTLSFKNYRPQRYYATAIKASRNLETSSENNSPVPTRVDACDDCRLHLDRIKELEETIILQTVVQCADQVETRGHTHKISREFKQSIAATKDESKEHCYLNFDGNGNFISVYADTRNEN